MEDSLRRFQELRDKAAVELETLKAERKRITDLVAAREDGVLSEEETREFRAKSDAIKSVEGRIAVLDEQISETKDEIERRGESVTAASIQKGQSRVEVISEPHTYRQGGRDSYFRDLVALTFNRADEGAMERMARHRTEVERDPEIRKLAKIGPEYRNLDRNDGQGGYAVPPLWMMNRFIALARPGRPFANLVPTEALPPGTDSINIPKIATGTTTAIQTADNTTISETDLTDTYVQANVKTIAGQQGLSIQLIEQSPIAFDEVVFRDLTAAYAGALDQQVINGTGLNNQVVGVMNTSGIQTVTSTGSGPDLTNAMANYKAIANAIQTVYTTRFLAPDAIVMHPRRWAAFLSVFGSDDRPLITTNGPGFNEWATLTDVAAQGVVGGMQGLPVVVDPNIPTTLGSGTNQDVIFVVRSQDLLLFESSIRARALQETRADGLTVLLQIFGYLAFTAARYPQSVVEITGTALSTPAFQ